MHAPHGRCGQRCSSGATPDRPGLNTAGRQTAALAILPEMFHDDARCFRARRPMRDGGPERVGLGADEESRLVVRTGIVVLKSVGGGDGPTTRKAAVMPAAFAVKRSCCILGTVQVRVGGSSRYIWPGAGTRMGGRSSVRVRMSTGRSARATSMGQSKWGASTGQRSVRVQVQEQSGVHLRGYRCGYRWEYLKVSTHANTGRSTATRTSIGSSHLSMQVGSVPCAGTGANIGTGTSVQVMSTGRRMTLKPGWGYF